MGACTYMNMRRCRDIGKCMGWNEEDEDEDEDEDEERMSPGERV